MIQSKKTLLHSTTTTLSQTDLLHQKFIEAALQMDASIVEPYIPEDMQLQDLDKYMFLAYLQDVFESIWQKHPEDYRVEAAEFRCGYCVKGTPLAAFAVYSGVEHIPYAKFGYVIETDANGITTDIYICTSMIE